MKTDREEWRAAYRRARIIYASNPSNAPALARLKGYDWLAYTIVSYRRSVIDPLDINVNGRLEAHKFIKTLA